MKTPSEIEFYNMFDNIRWATKEEDMFGHFDVVINGNIKVDIKGLKKINRTDANSTDDIHFIEFQNVRGETGWAKGKADYIAFEQTDCFIIVNRESMLNMCRSLITDRTIYNTKELYKLYRRKNRLDVMTMIKTSDLTNIPNKILYK